MLGKGSLMLEELERVYAEWEAAEAWRARYPHLHRFVQWAQAWESTVSPAYFSGSQTYRWLRAMGRQQ